MQRNTARRQDTVKRLNMPDQVLREPFSDETAPVLAQSSIPHAARLVLFGLPLVFAMLVGSMLVVAFQSDSQLDDMELALIALMTLLSGWEAMPTANAIAGICISQKAQRAKPTSSLSVAILVTIRDEIAQDVLPGKLELLRSLQNQSKHQFSLHVLSDSTSITHIAEEQRLVRQALPLPAFFWKRDANTDFKSGNIRNWIESCGEAYEAFIILDADSELESPIALTLADELGSDPGCGLIQTVLIVQDGTTLWQRMQSVASQAYGGLQGRGLAAWMGNEANYYGHNAIIRTKAFAASAGLPRLKGHGLWNGTILSHDFVEAALLRRAGWGVRLLPTESGSYEQPPTDVIAHLKRDARWCLGNFQHSRILGAAGLHLISRFHLFSGIFTYLTSAVWLTTLVLWGVLDAMQRGSGGMLATGTFVLMAINLLLPRALGVIHTARCGPTPCWTVAKSALAETLFSSLFAPSLMVQRIMIIGRVLFNRRVTWAPQEKANRSFPDRCIFHIVEVLVGLGLLACVERGFLTFWFLPLAVCFALAPVLSWISAQSTKISSHENLNATTPL